VAALAPKEFVFPEDPLSVLDDTCLRSRVRENSLLRDDPCIPFGIHRSG
jgi:hypothetical protein